MSYFLIYGMEDGIRFKQFSNDEKLIEYLDEYFSDSPIQFMDYIPQDCEEFHCGQVIVVKGEVVGTMKNNNLLERLDLLKRYLRANGWTRLDSNNSKLLFYQGPNDDSGYPIKIGLPCTVEFEDTRQLINQTIELIATLRKRTISEITAEIINFGCDFFRQRVITPTNSPTLPLSEINNLISSLTCDHC
jgi:hypothetical protein